MPVHWHGAPAGPTQPVWVYLPILSYSNYIWGVPIARQAELVARGCGKTGSSYDYLRLVLDELAALGVQEPTLERLFAEATRCLNGHPPPVRRADWPEQPSWSPPGSCGTCRQCCATPWLQPEKSVTCPFLGEKGCQVYGGVFWDYGNCGRYPESPEGVTAYRCPLFLPIATRPDV